MRALFDGSPETTPREETVMGQETSLSRPQTDENPPQVEPDGSNAPRASVTYSCGGCDNRWPGVSRCHCAQCHQTFAGAALFDRHRRDVKGVGTCFDPETLFTETKPPKPYVRSREMYLTNGIWQSVETPTVKVAPARRLREA